ncbi:MAG: amino acid adenylation domain-containing protein, partial [Eubacteriales bacterium]|nr:amino acid adenylation domain-containing protein [Eubacteriales bacterium]
MSQQKPRYALTHPQQRIWYSERLHPDTGMWNNAGTLKIKGQLNYKLLESAINIFLRDNESIRLRIGLVNDEPYQYIADYSSYAIDLMDFSDHGVSKLFEWDTMQTQVPMPLIDSNLFYFALFRLNDEEGGIYAKFHHIISDALSIVEFSNQIMENYASLLDGRPTPDFELRSYVDFISEEESYLKSSRFSYDQRYWDNRFNELPEPTFIKQKKTNYFSTKARRKAYVIPAARSARIRAYCEQAEISVFSLFLSALAIYINRITNKKDIIIGAPVVNRTSLHAKGAFGMFVSTVPIRIEIQDDLSFTEFAQVVSNEWFSALKHQKYPYDMLLQDLRKKHKGLESLYDVTLSYQIGKFHKNAKQFTYEGRWHFSGSQSNSLSIHVNDREDDGKFIVDYDHHTPFFSHKEIEYIHAHLNNIISDMIGHPDKPLFMLDLMSDEEWDRVVNRFNDTAHDYPEGETLVDLWYQCADKTPGDAVAVISEGRSMTYGELDARSTALALHLKKQGVGTDSIVGLLVLRTIDYCVSVLAILKAGGAFLPIDAELPEDRIAYMLADSGARILLISPELAEKCPPGLCTVKTNIPLALPDDTHVAPGCGPEHLAYVIYTSGSTGQPKGVQIEHRSIVHFVYSLNNIWDFYPGAKLLCAASISFDISVMELLLALLNGAALVMAKEHEVNIPRNMVRLIKSAQVNMMCVTPGRMELLLSDPQGPSCIKDFREIGMGGDVLSEKLLSKVQQSTNARITNFYGPTEITVCCTCTDVTRAKVPNIGRPMHNVKAYILDAHKNPVPIGVPGELYVGGKGVSRGYINKPELNRERFVSNPYIPGEKLYRTGDLVRWYPLGEIEFLGRIDKQVKIRGYRIELGEIENRLMQVAGVTACVVADREDASGRKYLCAYLCGNPPKKADIKAQLVRDLPAYMIPSYFMVIDSLPFGASGKVDRSRLPDPQQDEQEAMGEDYVPPETETEQSLAEIWRAALGAQQIGRNDSFFDIGGDSLSIVGVMSQVMHKFRVDIMLEDVYRSPRLKDFAALIDAAEECAYRPILPAPEQPDYPVSSAQQRMWVLMQGQESTAYNIPVAFAIHGMLDKGRLRHAFDRLIERHDALRTSFILKDGAIRQKIHDDVTFDIEYLKCAPKDLDALLVRLVKPFDMKKAPLMRVSLIETEPERHILFIDMHHSISDKRSLEILMSELAGFYSGRRLEPKGIEYKDYAVWQQEFLESEAISLQRDFWKSVLTGELPLLNLHTDRPRSAMQRFEGARVGFEINKEAADRLRAFAQQRGATLFMAVLAVYNVLLSKYTGQEDIIVGTPVSGRTRREQGDVMGVFLNTLPLRNYPRGDMSFSQFFEELVQNAVSALAHADYPIERIAADLKLPRDLSRNPLYDTMLVQAKGTYDLPLENVTASYYPFDPKIAKLDLTLEVYEYEDGLKCQFEYNTRLFGQQTVKRMSAHISRLFELLTDEPDIRLCDVAMMTPQEIWQVTQGFNQTDRPLDAELTVQSLLEEIARTQGEKAALIVGGKRMSFADLNARANEIAHRLRELGVGRNTIVALCIRRSFDMAAGLLGILKAGGGYLPLDPEYPQDRITFMLADSGARILLTDGAADMRFEGEVLRVQDIIDMPRENLAPVERMEDAAYVIYTSGSTGIPKGAVLPRRALLNLYEGTKTTIAYDKEQTSVSVTTVSFDIFVIDALLPLLFGCTVALCTEEELRQPHLLAKLIESADAGFIQTTPTRMRILMDDPSFRAAAAKHIKKIVLGGEEFPLSLLKLLKKYMNARIISGYGPTETMVYCTFKDLTNTSHITIGRPIDNTRMYILDRYKRPVPVGVLGEAYISGACVATGYIGRDDLNRKKFLPDPYWPGHTMYQSGDICAFMQNGEMEIRGRADYQVKIRGLRIELGEIEAAMRAIKGVEEAVVKDWDEGVGKFLCAYYAMSEEAGADTIRAHLSKKLPAYMVPSFFIGMSALPLTPNGKVDRKALKRPERDKIQGESGVPGGNMTDVEKKMARVWSRVLKAENIGPADNFFALGGDSLSVIKVQAALLQYGWNIGTQEFYDYQTLRAVCTRLNTVRGETVYEGVHAIEGKRDVPVRKYDHLEEARLEKILLTGATGYLGAHILAELADRPDTHIHCLVRGQDDKACEKYLRNVLTFYFGAGGCARVLSRVSVVRGNISLGRLGMDEPAYEDILGIDTVIHAAAITDHVGAAEMFDRVNVLGTKNVTELAARTRAALFHVSTVSVSGTRYVDDAARTGEFDENCYYVGQNYADNEYIRSKFMAEEIVLDAIENGLNARIFRVGMLTGTVDGRFQRRPE